MAKYCRMHERVMSPLPPNSSFVLGSLGISSREEQLYRVLVSRPGLTLREISSSAGVSTSTAKKVLAQLEEKGLLSRTPEAPLRFIPTAPDLAFEALIARREEELTRTKMEAGRLLEEFRAGTEETRTASPVDLVSGHEATRQRQRQVQRSARNEVRIFDLPPYVMPTDAPSPDELELLQAGIEYRVIYDETSFDTPGKLEAARACGALGEQARVFSGVPLKLMVADRLVALTFDPQKEIQHSMIVHPSPLLDTLIAYFDLMWERAIPLFGPQDQSSGDDDSYVLDAVDREILGMLGAGSGDEAIARRLGLGVRTVRRRLARLMEALHAKTRFEAGVRAAKEGWM